MQFNLKPTENKPVLRPTLNESPGMSYNVKKPPKPPVKPPRNSEEEATTTPSFLSQVKLKHVRRPSDDGSLKKDINQEPTNHEGPMFVKRDASPPVRSNVVPPKPSRTAPVPSNTGNQSVKPPVKPVKPVPVPRPGDKKSFLHAFMDKNPDVANQRIPPMMVQLSNTPA